MSPRDKAADLTLRETAAALGLSVGTVRAHIRAGRLHATQVVAKHGPEYRLRPAVVAAFGAERLGLELDAAALGKPAPSAAGTGAMSARRIAARAARAARGRRPSVRCVCSRPACWAEDRCGHSGESAPVGRLSAPPTTRTCGDRAPPSQRSYQAKSAAAGPK